MREDPEGDLQDTAEFFRRGDEGDYAEAESLPAGAIAFADGDLAESDAVGDPIDSAALAQQLKRRARFTRAVAAGIGVLAVATLVVFNQRSPGSSTSASRVGPSTSEPRQRAAEVPREAPSQIEPRERVAEAPPHEAPAPMQAPVVQDAREAKHARVISSRATNVALKRNGGATRRSVVTDAPLAATSTEKTSESSVLPAVTISRATLTNSPGASRLPTARFAD